MPFLLDLAWRDLRATGRGLWIFCACLILGVSLVAAGGGLYQRVADAMRADARALLGGDVEVEHTLALDRHHLDWMEARGAVSRLVELRTMLRMADGRSQLIELQSADARYPLYGEVVLAPRQSLEEALVMREGRWGMAVDAAMAQRLGLQVGDAVSVGEATLQIQALISRQPDRSLRADWGAAPVLVSDGALQATGLVQPLSRLEYRYRVKTDGPAAQWRDAFVAAFPDLSAEVRTFNERSDRMAEVLGQIGSGIMLIGFTALFIGGLGVSNSVQAYLRGKLTTLATLRALGLRDGRLARMVMGQILMLAALASAVGVLLGHGLAMVGVAAVADRLPAGAVSGVANNAHWGPLALAWVFGVLTALVFSLPALGRALSVSPATLFRGTDAAPLAVPRRAQWATAGFGVFSLALLVAALPDPRLGVVFALACAVVWWGLQRMVVALQRGGGWVQSRWGDRLPLAGQLALAGLQQPASPLRAALLSLGSALTLLVACTLVVMALLRTVNETVPLEAPALVFHDVQNDQLATLNSVLAEAPGLRRVQTAPLVLGRLVAVNGQALRDSADAERVLEARDEHKLSTRAGNIDDVIVKRGAWWPSDHTGAALVAMEDREADALGLKIGDRLRFDIMGTPVEAQLVAIFGQRRLQARLWLEAIFSDGVLDPHITRHVGAAYLPADQALQVQDRLAAQAPNIVSVHTESLLRETRALMARATAGLAVIAAVCLLASLLVLASVVAAQRSRQVYDATVMHALGARLSTLRRVLVCEYALLALLTACFSTVVGAGLATGLMVWRLDLSPAGVVWTGALTACAVSAVSLGMAARYLLRQMKLHPAALLRSGA